MLMMPSIPEEMNGASARSEHQQGDSQEAQQLRFMAGLDHRNAPKRTLLNTIGVPLAISAAQVAGIVAIHLATSLEGKLSFFSRG